MRKKEAEERLIWMTFSLRSSTEKAKVHCPRRGRNRMSHLRSEGVPLAEEMGPLAGDTMHDASASAAPVEEAPLRAGTALTGTAVLREESASCEEELSPSGRGGSSRRCVS